MKHLKKACQLISFIIITISIYSCKTHESVNPTTSINFKPKIYKDGNGKIIRQFDYDQNNNLVKFNSYDENNFINMRSKIRFQGNSFYSIDSALIIPNNKCYLSSPDTFEFDQYNRLIKEKIWGEFSTDIQRGITNTCFSKTDYKYYNSGDTSVIEQTISSNFSADNNSTNKFKIHKNTLIKEYHDSQKIVIDSVISNIEYNLPKLGLYFQYNYIILPTFDCPQFKYLPLRYKNYFNGVFQYECNLKWEFDSYKRPIKVTATYSNSLSSKTIYFEY